jgi:hypothetical protein
MTPPKNTPKPAKTSQKGALYFYNPPKWGTEVFYVKLLLLFVKRASLFRGQFEAGPLARPQVLPLNVLEQTESDESPYRQERTDRDDCIPTDAPQLIDPT